MYDYLVEADSDALDLIDAEAEGVDILVEEEQDQQVTETDDAIEILVADEQITSTPVATDSVDVVITDDASGTLLSSTAAVEMLEVLEAGPQGIPGPAGPVGPTGPTAIYVHTQAAPAAEWLVTHNLGAKITPTLVLTGNPGEPVITDVVFIDNNSLLVQWSQPETGWAYI